MLMPAAHFCPGSQSCHQPGDLPKELKRAIVAQNICGAAVVSLCVLCLFFLTGKPPPGWKLPFTGLSMSMNA